MTKPFTFGGEGADADPDIFAKLYKNVFGAKIKLVAGFPGTSDITLAMERGEVQGLCGLSWSTIKAQHPDWIKDKKIIILVQAAPRRTRSCRTCRWRATSRPAGEQQQILNLLLVGQTIARPFVAPPGIPADRKAALRAAFDATMKDPVFLAEANGCSSTRPVSGAGRCDDRRALHDAEGRGRQGATAMTN